MPLNARQSTEGKLDRLERAIRRARLALASERLWPRLVPILSVVGVYVVLSWLGYWRLGGDWLRLGTLGVLGARAALEPDPARPRRAARPRSRRCAASSWLPACRTGRRAG